MDNKTVEYYNNYVNKLLIDYVGGNPRIIAAIKKAQRWVPQNAKSILDIGCGIGWTTHELAYHRGQSKVLGVDLSPDLIRTAKTLFQLNNLSYDVHDLTEMKLGGAFDAVVMIDVYEHIAVSDRRVFHGALANIMKPNFGRLIITCPSVYHQAYLRNHVKDDLQPIDEDVDLSALLMVASDIGAELIHFEYINVWSSYDYIHVVMDRNVNYAHGACVDKNEEFEIEDEASRKNRALKMYPELKGELKDDVGFMKRAKRKVTKILSIRK